MNKIDQIRKEFVNKFQLNISTTYLRNGKVWWDEYIEFLENKLCKSENDILDSIKKISQEDEIKYKERKKFLMERLNKLDNQLNEYERYQNLDGYIIYLKYKKLSYNNELLFIDEILDNNLK